MGIALGSVHVDIGGGCLQSQPSELRVSIGVIDEDVGQCRRLERGEPHGVWCIESIAQREKERRRGGTVSMANDEGDGEGRRAKGSVDARQEESVVFHSEVVSVDVGGWIGEVERLRSVEDGCGCVGSDC